MLFKSIYGIISTSLWYFVTVIDTIVWTSVPFAPFSITINRTIFYRTVTCFYSIIWILTFFTTKLPMLFNFVISIYLWNRFTTFDTKSGTSFPISPFSMTINRTVFIWTITVFFFTIINISISIRT